MNEQIKTYRQVDTAGKSQIELILQVYGGAMASLQAARERYENHNLEAGYEQIEKARKFVVHLYTTLDFEKGGEVAQNLGKLYAFVLNELDVITATKDLAKIDSCITVLTNLKQGWDQLRQQDKAQKVAAPTAAVESLTLSA